MPGAAVQRASRNPDVLVDTAPPSIGSGYADDPNLLAWLARAPRGLPVTIPQHNAMVAALAWCQSVLATTPEAVQRIGDGGIACPFGVSDDGDVLTLGTTRFVDGDIVLPASTAPAGAEPVPAIRPVPPSTRVITQQQRRLAFDAATRCLENMRLWPQSIVSASPGDVVAAAMPAGALPAIAAGLVWPVVVVAVAGAGIYAGYRAYVETRVAESRASVERIRIQANAQTAAIVAQEQAKIQALTIRVAHAQQTGVLLPPSPIEGQPIVVPQVAPPPAGENGGWSTLEIVGATVIAAGVIGGGAYAVTKYPRLLGMPSAS